MSDFLVCLDRSVKGAQLLALLKRPYGDRRMEGWAFDLAWGSLAVLKDPIVQGRNLQSCGAAVLAWVGDLILPNECAILDAALATLNGCPPATQGNKTQPSYEPHPLILAFSPSGGEGARAVEGVASGQPVPICGPIPVEPPREILEQANGAFAMLGVSAEGFWVMTDPMASVQVYVGRNRTGALRVVGTHSDLVARCLDDPCALDLASVADFLDTGTPCCPYTMYRNIRELAPGTVIKVTARSPEQPVSQEKRYWLPPAESANGVSERDLVQEFIERWRRAVQSRCLGDKLGVELSGGLDSRIVISCLLPNVPCAALTLLDEMNREARVARAVAQCYGREWIPLERNAEYLARTLVPSTRLTGCEGEWHHGHAMGFADRVAELGIRSLFTGLLMDNNFKGYYADDVVRVSRWGGLLPARFELRRRDYTDANRVSAMCRAHLHPGSVSGILERRRAFVTEHFACSRSSPNEWLDGYPYSQASDNTGWTIERRLMPIRLPVMDRAMLDLAFRVPIQLKAGGRFFERAAVQLLGTGRWIPNANDGARPGSGHWWRLVQRGGRKFGKASRTVAERLGFRLSVPHSWHDYNRYWMESPQLAALKREHGSRLREFEGTVFTGESQPLLQESDYPWRSKYRVLQLAVWRSLIEEYRL